MDREDFARQAVSDYLSGRITFAEGVRRMEVYEREQRIKRVLAQVRRLFGRRPPEPRP